MKIKISSHWHEDSDICCYDPVVRWNTFEGVECLAIQNAILVLLGSCVASIVSISEGPKFRFVLLKFFMSKW